MTLKQGKEALKQIDLQIEQQIKLGKTIKGLLEERQIVIETMTKNIYAIQDVMYGISDVIGVVNADIAQLIGSATQLITSLALGDVRGTFGAIVGIFRSMIDKMEEAKDKVTPTEKLNKSLEVLNRNFREQIKLLAEINGTPWLENIVGMMKNAKEAAWELAESLEGVNVVIKIGNEYISTRGWDLQKWQEMAEKYPRIGEIFVGYGPSGEDINVQDIIDAINLSKEQINNMMDQFMQELTGTTTGAIADGIAQGFSEGLDPLEIYANTFEDLIRNSMLNALKRSLYDTWLTEWYKKFGAFAEGGLTAEELRILSEGEEGFVGYREAIENAAAYWKSMQEVWKEIFPGEEMFPGAEPETLAGAIKGITEDTAGVLAGQMMAIRINVAEGLEVAENSFLQLVEIAENTSYNRYLEQITAILQQNSEQALLRSGG